MNENTVKTSTKTAQVKYKKTTKDLAILSILFPSKTDRWNELKSTQKVVLMVLIQKTTYCNENRLEKAGYKKLNFSHQGYYIRYTQEAIGKEVGVSRKTICNTIEELVNKGCIEVISGGKNKGDYSYPSVACIPVEEMAKSYERRMKQMRAKRRKAKRTKPDVNC